MQNLRTLDGLYTRVKSNSPIPSCGKKRNVFKGLSTAVTKPRNQESAQMEFRGHHRCCKASLLIRSGAETSWALTLESPPRTSPRKFGNGFRENDTTSSSFGNDHYTHPVQCAWMVAFAETSSDAHSCNVLLHSHFLRADFHVAMDIGWFHATGTNNSTARWAPNLVCGPIVRAMLVLTAYFFVCVWDLFTVASLKRGSSKTCPENHLLDVSRAPEIGALGDTLQQDWEREDMVDSSSARNSNVRWST